MEFTDQLNRKISLSATPNRIVSLVPSQTELLVDLGLRDKLVGITKFCVHPSGLRDEKLIVGGTKTVNFKKIKSLHPDIIICNKEENTLEIVRELENIAPVWISDIVSVEDSLVAIQQLGELFNVGGKASEIILNINIEKAKHDEFIQGFTSRKVLYLIWKKPYMAAGRDTFINSLLQLNNFENVCDLEEGRYPEVDASHFEKADLILLSSEPYPFNFTDVEAFQNKYSANVKLIDGEFFSWYGSRLIEAFSYFKILH